MKNNVKESIKEFMNSQETKAMNTNEFIVFYFKYEHFLRAPKYSHFSLANSLLRWVSVEWITRARRYAIKYDWFAKRINADTEEEYKQEFKTKK